MIQSRIIRLVTLWLGSPHCPNAATWSYREAATSLSSCSAMGRKVGVVYLLERCRGVHVDAAQADLRRDRLPEAMVQDRATAEAIHDLEEPHRVDELATQAARARDMDVVEALELQDSVGSQGLVGVVQGAREHKLVADLGRGGRAARRAGEHDAGVVRGDPLLERPSRADGLGDAEHAGLLGEGIVVRGGRAHAGLLSRLAPLAAARGGV
mmetsp:Transcript_5477/g.14090  ORF Transcript_5477/g.14090 Transcript_5477/m.14090 type:complete len:211 (+) Transcript_5477:164-796(+)